MPDPIDQLYGYEPALLEKFPQTRWGFVLGRGLHNPPSSAELRRAYADEQRATLARLGERSPTVIPPLAAWRRTFSAFGVSPTKYRCAAEALLRRLRKVGEIPYINTLVDIGNLVSLRYSLPVLVYDLAKTSGAVTVRLAHGDEVYFELHRQEHESPPAGEVIFVDERNRVIARRWCWRQSAESAVSADTTEAMIIIEAQHERGGEDTRAATQDLLALVLRYAGETAQIVSGSQEAAATRLTG